MLVNLTSQFELEDIRKIDIGNVIQFTLSTGETVQAMAMEKTDKGVLFITVDCLNKEYCMYKNLLSLMPLTYNNSDLRKTLNGRILKSFPYEIRNHLVPVNELGDLLRIPTEKEILGWNPFGDEEPANVQQFKPMQHLRNRMAFCDEQLGWYWLENRTKDKNHTWFTFVGIFGVTSDCLDATYSRGVRPLFCLAY